MSSSYLVHDCFYDAFDMLNPRYLYIFNFFTTVLVSLLVTF